MRYNGRLTWACPRCHRGVPLTESNRLEVHDALGTEQQCDGSDMRIPAADDITSHREQQ
jgi:hypothetical protein